MVRLSSDEFLSWMRRAIRIKPTPVAVVTETTRGPVISLDEYRKQMASRRVELVGKAGVWLDQSPTGAGKSHADLAAFQQAGKSLSIQPTHENCEEVVKACRDAGIDAAAYPGRFSQGKAQNCWNTDADAAESMGLSVVRTVCHGSCEHRRKCLEHGYLGQVARANEARVAVATHARAIHSGLAELMEGRDYVSTHEDAMGMLMPQQTASVPMLESAQYALNRLLNDPEWLDRFGEASEMDGDGETWASHKHRTARRDAQYEFLKHLADVVDNLLQRAARTQVPLEIPPGRTIPEPPGVQAILFHLCRELGIQFGAEPVWPLLLCIATENSLRAGILMHEETTFRNSEETNDGQESDCADSPQSPAQQRDCDSVGCFG